MESLFVLVLHGFDVIKVWLSVCVTCFIVLSIMSPWLMSSLELDLGEIELFDIGVLWLIGVEGK